jgi:undecaprenyl-diphosphatase
MSLLSGNPYFNPALVLMGLLLVWKGGPRGIVLVCLLGLAAAIANEFIVEPLKHWVLRSRPYVDVADTVLRVGRGTSTGSFPSGHATNAALMAAFAGWYYPRSLVWVLPIATGIAVSRIYNGAHYPSDVLAGVTIGILSAAATILIADAIWRRLVLRRHPAWAVWMPSLLHPGSFPRRDNLA